jgi:hypothetical protein
MTTAQDALDILGSTPIWGCIMKLAADQFTTTSAVGMTKGPYNLTSAERANIRRSIKVLAPRTKSEEDVRRLAGAPLTKGQIARAALVGATLVPLIGVGRRSLTEPIKALARSRGVAKPLRDVVKESLREGTREALNPGGIVSDVIGGVTFGAAMPVVKRWADIEAARRGQF